MNVDQLKVEQKKIDERILTSLKEKAPLYAGEAGLKNKQQHK